MAKFRIAVTLAARPLWIDGLGLARHSARARQSLPAFSERFDQRGTARGRTKWLLSHFSASLRATRDLDRLRQLARRKIYKDRSWPFPRCLYSRRSWCWTSFEASS